MSNGGDQIPAVVELDHGFFRVFSEPYFRTSEPPIERPVLCANLGDQQVVLPVDGIIRELGLAEVDPLHAMLTAICASLKFVGALRPGDDIPAEVRTGDASWEAGPDHLEVARQRLTMQLVTWVSGRETMFTSARELRQLFDDPSIKQKISDAFAQAADRLGLADQDEVANLVESFAEELAYVEALRERYAEIAALFERIQVLRKNFGSQHRVMDEVDPVVRLMKKPVSDFQTNFDLIDAQTGEIMTVLSKLDVERQYVRDVRNDLYVRFEAWQPIIDQWRNVNPRNPQDFNVSQALRELYRFLAQRYMEPDEWVLTTALKKPEGTKLRYGGVMTW